MAVISNVFRNRISAVGKSITEKILKNQINDKYQLRQEINMAVSRIIDTIGEPYYNEYIVNEFQGARSVKFNEYQKELWDEFQSIYGDIKIMRANIINSFNNAWDKKRKIELELAQINNMLTGYAMQSQGKIDNVLIKSNDFSNFDDIDFDFSIDKSTLHINREEGTATLKELKRISLIDLDTKVIVGSNSNGKFNVEKNNLSSLIDNNPETWIEYEQDNDSISELKLELIFELKNPTIINHISILPYTEKNNYPYLQSILISNNAMDYIDIMSEDTEFHVNELGSKLKTEISEYLTPTQGRQYTVKNYKFQPKFGKYIKFIFKQSNKIKIDNKDILKIGIRDITISQIEYDLKSEIVTKEIETSYELGTISLIVNEVIPNALIDIPDSNQASDLQDSRYYWIKYFISIDNGGQWYKVNPMNHEGDKDIYLTINNSDKYLGDEYISILNDLPVNRVRLKMEVERSTQNIEIESQEEGKIPRVLLDNNIHSINQQQTTQNLILGTTIIKEIELNFTNQNDVKKYILDIPNLTNVKLNNESGDAWHGSGSWSVLVNDIDDTANWNEPIYDSGNDEWSIERITIKSEDENFSVKLNLTVSAGTLTSESLNSEVGNLSAKVVDLDTGESKIYDILRIDGKEVKNFWKEYIYIPYDNDIATTLGKSRRIIVQQKKDNQNTTKKVVIDSKYFSPQLIEYGVKFSPRV